MSGDTEQNAGRLKLVEIRQREIPDVSERMIRRPEDAIEAMRELIGNLDREAFAVLNLSSKGQVLNASICTVGTVNAALVSPPETFRAALLSGAASIIAVHNHPSGFCEPSKEDIQITKRLVSAGNVLGIPLLDHIILGKNQEYSFAENMPSVFRRSQLDRGIVQETEELSEFCREPGHLESRTVEKAYQRARKPVKTRLP